MIQLVCPADPKHGRLLAVTNSRWGWYCPHVAHDGRGDVPQTRSHFTTREVEAGLLDDLAPVRVPVAVPPTAAGDRTHHLSPAIPG